MKKTEGEAILNFVDKIRQLQLAEFRLLESGCKLGKLQGGKLPDKVRLETKLNVLRQDDDNAKFIVVVAAYKLFSGYDEQSTDDESAAVTVNARFGIKFSHAEPKSDAELGKVAAHLGVMTSWSFWREFVHSMTIRMGLPAIHVPVMNVGEVVKEDEPSGSPKQKGRLKKGRK